MHAQITARHFEADPMLRQHVAEQLSKLDKCYDGITGAHIVLENGKASSNDKRAEITLSVYRQRLSATDTASSHEVAVSRCVNRLRRQILRYKSRLRDPNLDKHR
jgi:ribosomal subunit interface protein